MYRIYPVPNLSFTGLKQLKQSNEECNDVYRIHLVPNLSCTEFWSYVKCWKIKIVCIFLYRIYHVPNLSCTEFSMYRIYHVPNLSCTEFSIYRIYNVPNLDFTKRLKQFKDEFIYVYPIFHVPNFSCTEFINYWILILCKGLKILSRVHILVPTLQCTEFNEILPISNSLWYR